MIDACIECASHITRGTLTRVSLCKCLLTFIHVLEVLVELLLAGFPVLFPLDDVTSVLDVMTDEHLLQSGQSPSDSSWSPLSRHTTNHQS